MHKGLLLALLLNASGVAVGQPALLDPPAGPGSMAVNLAASGDTVLLSWLEPPTPKTTPSDENAVWAFRFSRLEGGAWTAPTTIATDADFFLNWADIPSLVDAGGGRLLAHWAIKTGSMAYDIGLAGSQDGGTTWKHLGKLNEDATPSEHGFVSLLADRGEVRAFWLDGRERKGQRGAQALRTAAVGDRSGASEQLDERVCDCCQTAAAQTADGPIVAYRDRSKDEVRDIAIVRRTDKGWSAPRLVASDGWRIVGCPVNGPAAAAKGKRVAVAWFTAAKDRPKVEVAFSADAGLTFGKAIVVDGADPMGRVGVELDGEDAIVLWAATEGKAPSIRMRRVSPSGNLGPSSLIAPTSLAQASGFPRIRHAGNDLVLAWLDPKDPPRVHAARMPASSIQ